MASSFPLETPLHLTPPMQVPRRPRDRFTVEDTVFMSLLYDRVMVHLGRVRKNILTRAQGAQEWLFYGKNYGKLG